MNPIDQTPKNYAPSIFPYQASPYPNHQHNPYPQTPTSIPFLPPVPEQPSVKAPQLIQIQLQSKVQDNQNQGQYLTQSHVINRKSLNGLALPLYVKIGKAECDTCRVKEIIHGYHNEPNRDICIRCFLLENSMSNPLTSSWVEFNAE